MNAASQPRTSGLAIMALASSVIFCLPIGAVLGVVALVRIRRSKGALGGSWLGLAALLVSLVLNLGTYFFMSQVYPVLMNNSECFAQQLLVGRELSKVQKAQWSFKDTHQRFGTLDEIGFEPASRGDTYGYKVLTFDEKTFLVRATANSEVMGGDAWELDQTGIPRNVVSGCIR